MSKTSAKLALALLVVIAAPAASYARTGGGVQRVLEMCLSAEFHRGLPTSAA
jgi:hypothetical protein